MHGPRALCRRIHRAKHDLAAGLGSRTTGARCPASRQPATRACAKAAGLAGGRRVYVPEPPRAHAGAYWQSGPGTTLALVEQAAHQLTPRLHESFGLRGLAEATVFQWLWGWLTHLRRRGGVMHPELTTLARDGAIWALVNTAGRDAWMPGMGERTPFASSYAGVSN